MNSTKELVKDYEPEIKETIANEASTLKSSQLSNNFLTDPKYSVSREMPTDSKYSPVPDDVNLIHNFTPVVANERVVDDDPWALPEFHQDTMDWNALTSRQKAQKIIADYIIKPCLLLILLYLFICSLDLLSSSFKLLGGKTAGKVFLESKLLNNSIAGLMIGVLVTVLLQSSSTTTSIVVTMVASGILTVKPAIPIIMGANVGTSVTNTIVSMASVAKVSGRRKSSSIDQSRKSQNDNELIKDEINKAFVPENNEVSVFENSALAINNNAPLTTPLGGSKNSLSSGIGSISLNTTPPPTTNITVTNTDSTASSSTTTNNEFRRAFAAATLHDMFNWLTVCVLLPLESVTGLLYHLTYAIVNKIDYGHLMGGNGTNIASASNKEILSVVTRSFTSLFIVLDKNVIDMIAMGNTNVTDKSLVKRWCPIKTSSRNLTKSLPKETSGFNDTSTLPSADLDQQSLRFSQTSLANTNSSSLLLNDGTNLMTISTIAQTSPNNSSTPLYQRCKFLFAYVDWSDSIIGTVLLILSLLMLTLCLIGIVKVLHSMLKGKIALAIRKVVNADIPWPFTFLTGYLAIAVGALMTFLLQSSSVFTSALTPLVGIGVISLERVYPLTLGSNLGTTATGLLASLTASPLTLRYSLQIALCHTFFNILGILAWYPIPALRFPLTLAKIMGATTAKYTWFAAFYLIFAFFVIPGSVFALSTVATAILPETGDKVSSVLIFMITGIIAALLLLVFFVNRLQKYRADWLPPFLRNWNFLPRWCRSLEPLDQIITGRKLRRFFGRKVCRKARSSKQHRKTSLRSNKSPTRPLNYSAFNSTNTLLKQNSVNSSLSSFNHLSVQQPQPANTERPLHLLVPTNKKNKQIDHANDNTKSDLQEMSHI